MHLLRRLGNRYEPPMHLVLGLRKIAGNDSKMLISAEEAKYRHNSRTGECSTTPFRQVRETHRERSGKLPTELIRTRPRPIRKRSRITSTARSPAQPSL